MKPCLNPNLWTSCQFRQNQDIQHCPVVFCKIGKIHKATLHEPSKCWNSKKFSEFQQFRYLSSCTLPEGNAATCWWCFLHVGTEHLQNHATLQELLEFLSKWKEPYNVLQSLWWWQKITRDLGISIKYSEGLLWGFLKFKYRTFCNPNANTWKKAMRSLLLVL